MAINTSKASVGNSRPNSVPEENLNAKVVGKGTTIKARGHVSQNAADDGNTGHARSRELSRRSRQDAFLTLNGWHNGGKTSYSAHGNAFLLAATSCSFIKEGLCGSYYKTPNGCQNL